jgi:SpoVK/Ycf46/Vps4 family AAA+-type ATPase
LNKPLHVKRVSDIVSPYLGMTERNLARAFHEADAENAVLLLDEVDSFLQDRRQAQRSWEITAVNEMLVQMESFNGVFVASTNLMKGLDQAALRRFDLKLNFSYLKPVQAWALFQRYATVLNLPETGKSVIEESLKRMCKLTPGDFAAVARQARFCPIVDSETLLKALNNECMMKDGQSHTSIGFM